ncbi:MAG TPA: GtrA family protein [Clostridiales bacterium]|nr:GtrA family protein [Clostridiales bacterium]
MKKKIEFQLIKFGLIGLLNTAVDFGVFTLLTMTFRMDSTVSHIISYSCGVINSYFFNRSWTFKLKGKSHPVEFIKFVLVNLVSLGLSSLTLQYLETKAGFSVYLAKLGAIFCSLAINFAGSKLIVFKE